jgi:hypothetical protein
MSNNSNKHLAKSPNRNTFQKEKYLERNLEEGKTLDDPEVVAMIDHYNQMSIDQDNRELDPEWKKNNLEYDLRSTEWICAKVKQDEHYAQNLYAAMCNNDFQKLEVIPILTEQRWSCSWRYAGGIISDMREEGDYIDWYCSGIRDDYDANNNGRNYVPECTVTDEIREDLKQLGWVVIDQDDE